MTNQIASAILALAFAAVLIVAGQLYIEKISTSTERVIAATLICPRAKSYPVHAQAMEFTRPPSRS
jgi:hypothetical protein